MNQSSHTDSLFRTLFNMGFQPGFITLWTFLRCTCKTVLSLYPFPQISHLEGLSPVCSLSWAVTASRLLNILSQYLHFSFGGSCFRMWLLNSHKLPFLIGQYLHWYFSSVECSTFLCSRRCFEDLKLLPHKWQISNLPSWTTLMCSLSANELVNRLSHLSQYR